MWACNNPFAEAGKELCDILIVCDPYVIIVSVKDINLNTDKEAAGFERWERKAVDDSVKQIYGAEKSLRSAERVMLRDGSYWLNLPPLADRKIHRIAVAFGSKGQVPIRSGDFGKGFVHVMHEHSFFHLLTELDTITDLIHYLNAKEALAYRCALVVEGTEVNLLGMYLFNNRTFPTSEDFMVVGESVWSELIQKPEWKRRKEADEPSYAWDRLIEMLSDPRAKSIEGPEPELNDLELALRSMARETRFHRRALGMALQKFLTMAKENNLRSRAVMSPSGIIYVFVYFTSADEFKSRTPELALRCVAARRKAGQGDAVVGIGIGEYELGKGSTSDVVYLRPANWSEFIARSEPALEASGYFSKSSVQKYHHDEYPKS